MDVETQGRNGRAASYQPQHDGGLHRLNQADDGTMIVPADYLEVVTIKG